MMIAGLFFFGAITIEDLLHKNQIWIRIRSESIKNQFVAKCVADDDLLHIFYTLDAHLDFQKESRNSLWPTCCDFYKRYLAESNCSTRFCRPLPNRSAKVPFRIAVAKVRQKIHISKFFHYFFFESLMNEEKREKESYDFPFHHETRRRNMMGIFCGWNNYDYLCMVVIRS